MGQFQTPRPYQKKAIDRSIQELNRCRSVLIESPTGSGKTLIFSLVIYGFAANKRVVILAPTDELTKQPFRYDWLAERGGRDAWDAQIIATTPQGALANIDKILRNGPIGLIVADECHGAIARQAFEVIRIFRKQGAASLGVSATPDRRDQQMLNELFDVSIVATTIVEAIERGDLSYPYCFTYSIDGEPIIGRDDEIDKMVEIWWQKTGGKPQTIWFTPTIGKAEAYAAALRETGVTAEAISGRTAKQERSDLINRYYIGEIQILVNADLLVQGVDLDCTRCIVIAKHTESRKVFSQAVGRGLRLDPNGDNKCIIICGSYSPSFNLNVPHNGLERPRFDIMKSLDKYEGLSATDVWREMGKNPRTKWG